jgi:hypothetical protein
MNESKIKYIKVNYIDILNLIIINATNVFFFVIIS